MVRNRLLPAALAILHATSALGQSTTSADPLNAFLGGINSAAGIISQANAKQTPSMTTSPSSTSPSSTSSSPTQAAATSSAAAATNGGGISHKTLIIAVVCAVVGVVLLGLLIALLCCCCMRRRHKKKRAVTPVADEEVKSWKGDHSKPNDHTYIPPQYGNIPDMEQQPMIAPPVAARGQSPNRGNTPNIGHYPAYRHENPFVPVPPSPRRTAPNSREGLTDGTVPGDAPYVLPAGDPEKQRLRSRSRSHSRSRPNTRDGLPMTTNSDRPPTPFGLSGIGQPYEDMHVHQLQTDTPSKELQQSLNNRDPLASAQREPTPGFTTPPENPTVSPRRSDQYSDSPYTTETSSYTGSSDEYHPVPQSHYPLHPGQGLTSHPQSGFASQPMHQSSHPNNRFSNSPTTIQAPPVPWAEGSGQRRHSPIRESGEWSESGRRTSRSPATSINGQPRRLRFSDLQSSPATPGNAPAAWEQRYGNGGVGEAM